MRPFLFLAAPLLALMILQPAFGQSGPPPAGQAAPAAAAANELPPTAPGPASAPAASTYRQQVGYMLGQNIGSNLRDQQIDCDLTSLFAGISDALRGAKPRWSDAELQAAAQQFAQEMRQKTAGQRQQMQQLADKNAKQADAFLAANKQRPGVQVTASGLQYKVLKQGNGPSPTLADTVRCHYRGTLVDGTEFDSSYGGDPAVFSVRGVIPGWTEALQKMHVGDKWQLFVPPDLAYGADPPTSSIEPNSLLVFEIELLGIEGR
jgi:FKBP-type peptidyl-prolyl cis-trans isomerase